MKNKTTFRIFLLLLLGSSLMLSLRCSKDSTNNDINNPPDTTNTGDTTQIPAGWSKVGDLNANNMIWSLSSDAGGNVYAAGYFTNSGGYRYVARWDGTAWSDLGNLKANSYIFSITADAGGNVFAVGDFSNGITPDGGNKYVARWDGSQWHDIGGGGGTQITSDANGNVYKYTFKWAGSDWTTLCPACSLSASSVRTIVSNAAGTVQYAGGDFQHPNGARYVARCDGSNCWTELGNLNANGNIDALALDANGNVYAAGSFTNGSLPTTGTHYVAKWDGTSWSQLGSLNANAMIYFLAVDPTNNNVYASGYFTNSKGESYVAEWDGTKWNDLGNMMLAPTPIWVDASGTLYSVVAASDGQKFNVVRHD